MLTSGSVLAKVDALMRAYPMFVSAQESVNFVEERGGKGKCYKWKR
jgi:hypothetical protein